MPAVTSDTIALPRVPDPGPKATERPVLSVTTAPSGIVILSALDSAADLRG